MRLRFGLLALAALVASCATAPPPAPPSPPPDTAGLLAAWDAKLTSSQKHPSELSTPDLNLYSGLLLAAGRLPEAETALLALKERAPDNPETLWTLTLLAAARGDGAAEEKRLADYEKASPGSRQAANLRASLLLQKGDRAGAKATWLSIVAGAEDAEALSGLARLALDAKKNDEAAKWADRAVAAAPQDDQVWALRASVKTEQGAYLEARADLDQAVKQAPEDPWHRLDRGRLAFRHLYRNEDARADLEYATMKIPDNFLGWEVLAETYEELNRPRQAWDAWLKTLSLRPDYRFGYPSAAMLSFRYQDWNHAAAYAREAAKDFPGEYAFPFVEALSLRALGQLAAAQTVLERARPRFPRGGSVDEMFRFLLTPGSDYYLNTALNLEKKDTVRLRLRFYQGCYYALTSSARSARAAFEEVADSALIKIPEIGAARDWLDHGL